ncbi:MAG: hypothetical protein ACE147_05870 [Candidatus Methylomirabilales bacterium]
MTGSRDYGRLEGLLADTGLDMPPVPESLERQLKERDAWYFSTRSFKASPGALMHYVRKAIEGALPDFVLIAHTDDGVPAPALHYYLLASPLQLFLQIRWARGEASGAREAAAANESIGLAHQVVRAVPQAVRRGRLSVDGRFTVVGSDFVEGFWEVSMSGERAARPGAAPRGVHRPRPTPPQVLGDALAWLRR